MPRRQPTTTRQRPSDLEAAAIVARHTIPLIGVFALGWSPLEVICSLFLDSLSTLARAAGIGTYFVTHSLAHDDQDWADRLNLIAGGIVVFFIVLGLMAFALAVLGFFVWAYVLRSVDFELADLARDRALLTGFGAMLACQVPGALQFIRSHSEESARQVLEPEVGFVMRRVAFVVILCSFLGILPGEIALGAAIVMIQMVLAASEIFRGHPILRSMGEG